MRSKKQRGISRVWSIDLLLTPFFCMFLAIIACVGYTRANDVS